MAKKLIQKKCVNSIIQEKDQTARSLPITFWHPHQIPHPSQEKALKKFKHINGWMKELILFDLREKQKKIESKGKQYEVMLCEKKIL